MCRSTSYVIENILTMVANAIGAGSCWFWHSHDTQRRSYTGFLASINRMLQSYRLELPLKC